MADVGGITKTGAIFLYRKGPEVKGKWVVGDETHDVTVCKTKNWLFDFFRYFNMSAIYIRTKTHTFKINKEQEFFKTKNVALKALRESPTIIQATNEQEASSETLRAVKTFEAEKEDDIPVQTKDNTYVACRRNKEGVIETVTFTTQEEMPEKVRSLAFKALDHPSTLQIEESWNRTDLYFCTYNEGSPLEIKKASISVDRQSSEILTLLSEKQQKTYENLMKTALSEGKASVLFAHNNQLVRLNVTKTEAGIQASCSNPDISIEQLVQAGYTRQEAEQIKPTIDERIQTLFTSMASSGERTLQNAISSQAPHDYVLLHVKKDGTVTIGLRKSFAEGSFKRLQQESRINIQTNVFALAIPKEMPDPSQQNFSTQIESMEKLRGHAHVVQLLKKRDKSIKTLSQQGQTNVTTAQHLLGARMKLYREGTIEQLLPLPLNNPKAFLERVQIASDIAEGLQNMHAYRDISKAKYAVMDVKSGNVLLHKDEQGNLRADVTDIALYQEGTRHFQHSKEFLPPEGLRELYWEGTEGKASQKYDVWAFGMTLFSLMYPDIGFFFPKGTAFRDETEFRQCHQNMLGGLEDFDQRHPEFTEINDIIRDALSWDPEDRPSMEQLSQRLQAILQTHH